jgi:hypothetical protein
MAGPEVKESTYSHNMGVDSDEKMAHAKDSDSSSGKIETVETGMVPSANLMVVDKQTERAVLRKLDYRIGEQI